MMIERDKKKRLLCIVSTMNTGGAETFLMKVYRALDKTKYQMDFYCMSKEEGYYEKEILSLGGKVYHSVPKTKHPIKAFLALKNFVKRENYVYVLRAKQHSIATFDLLAARMGGARILVQRSSNADSNDKISKLLHELFKWLPKIIPTIKIAPSTESANYTFGKSSIEKGDVKIIKNAIPVEKFLFNQKKRNEIRNELKLQDKFVVGHVGRFSNQKNHSFIIDIFSEIYKKYDQSVLVLVGQGELEKDIKLKVERLGLTDKVIFMGVRSDVSEILLAMDVFVFPSFFEGMPNTVIEAQASGLPCLISDTITQEANITKMIRNISINDMPVKWANVALEYKDSIVRGNMRNQFIDNGYDITKVTLKLENLIFDDDSE